MFLTIEYLITEAIRSGGATINLTDNRGRYVIGGIGTHEFPREFALTTPSIDNAARQLTYKRESADTLGSWLDTNTGLIWLDYGTREDDLQVALSLASARNELAIWDDLDKREIRL